MKQPGSYPSKGSTKTCIAISRDESDRGTAERNGFSLETSHVSNLLPSEVSLTVTKGQFKTLNGTLITLLVCKGLCFNNELIGFPVTLSSLKC